MRLAPFVRIQGLWPLALPLAGKSEVVQGIDHRVAKLRQGRHAQLHLSDRELRILVAQRAEAAAGFGLGPGPHIRRTHGSMHPGAGGMIAARPLLPPGAFSKIASRQMRAADADHVIEGQGIPGREVERYLEPFDGRMRITAISVDPAAAAPGPGRATVNRERLANDGGSAW